MFVILTVLFYVAFAQLKSQVRHIAKIGCVQEFESGFFVENGGIFACFLAVIAPNAKCSIFRHSSLHVVQLVYQNFLCAEYVRTFKIKLVAHRLLPYTPSVAPLHIAVVVVADVLRAHIQVLCTKHQHPYEGNQQ